MDRPDVEESRRPETMLVMSEASFALQFGSAELARLRAASSIGTPLATHELSSAAARRRLAEVEVILSSWGCPPLTAAVLEAAPRLRAVLHAAGSVRGHVGDIVRDRGLLVTTAADANAEPVARYAIAAILWALKKVPFLAQDARRFRDDVSYRDRRGDLSAYDKTVVVVGFSRIGRRVADLLRPLHDGPVLVVDPFADRREVSRAGAELVVLEDALVRADVVSLHAPALPSTLHMLGASELASLRDGSTIVNTARGSLVDPAALERELVTGRLCAILDVTEPEPLPAGSPLYELSNVMLTPHIAGSTGTETRRLADAALTELERYAAGLPPLHPVNWEDLKIQA